MTARRTAIVRAAFTAALTTTLTFAGCAKAHPAAASAPHLDPLQQLRNDLASQLDQPGHRRTAWGVAVLSLAGGDRLFERNAGSLLVPASAMKLVTAATAAAAVGWDHVFETTAEIGSPVENGVLHGDLVITGTGDPSPHGRGGTDYATALVAALREKGITRIDGRVVGDDNLVEEPRPGLAWSWDDLGTASGVVSGALNIAENTLSVVVRPGATEGAATSIEMPAEARAMTIVNRSTTTPRSGQTLWAEQRPGETGLTIAGTLAADAKPATLVVAAGNPTLWFARFVRARLVAAGIDVGGDAVDVDDLPELPARGTLVYTHLSRPLADIVKPMLKNSINMYADAVLRLATGPRGLRTTKDAIAAERAQLLTWGVAEDAIQIADGSGLSRFNVIAPDALLTILRRLYEPNGASPFMEALPVAGVDGSLAERMRGTPAAGNARAKTGSMTNVRSLTGYVTTAEGEPLAFVIVANNFEGAPAIVTATMDRIVVRLAGFRRR